MAFLAELSISLHALLEVRRLQHMKSRDVCDYAQIRDVPLYILSLSYL